MAQARRQEQNASIQEKMTDKSKADMIKQTQDLTSQRQRMENKLFSKAIADEY